MSTEDSLPFNESGNTMTNCRIHNMKTHSDFADGAVVKNPPANAGDTGSSPGPGRSHMQRSN